jgi:hypothetical protein
MLIEFRYGGADMNFAEISSYLGKAEGTLRVQHHRLLKRLHNRLIGDPRLQHLLQRTATKPTKEQ